MLRSYTSTRDLCFNFVSPPAVVCLLTCLKCRTTGRYFQCTSRLFRIAESDWLIVFVSNRPHFIFSTKKKKTLKKLPSSFLTFDGQYSDIGSSNLRKAITVEVDRTTNKGPRPSHVNRTEREREKKGCFIFYFIFFLFPLLSMHTVWWSMEWDGNGVPRGRLQRRKGGGDDVCANSVCLCNSNSNNGGPCLSHSFFSSTLSQSFLLRLIYDHHYLLITMVIALYHAPRNTKTHTHTNYKKMARQTRHRP